MAVIFLSTQTSSPVSGSLLELQTPDGGFQATYKLVSEAAPLIAALESGIPEQGDLLKGILKIPLGCWSIRHSCEGPAAVTMIRAFSQAEGAPFFQLILERRECFWEATSKIHSPHTAYSGTISYSLSGKTQKVQLSGYPGLLSSVIDVLERNLQEPAVAVSKHSEIQIQAALVAENMEWTLCRLTKDPAAERTYLRDKLRGFLSESANRKIVDWSSKGSGESYQIRGVPRAWMYTFAERESLVIARVAVECNNGPTNPSEELPTTLVVGVRGMPCQRFEMLFNHKTEHSRLHEVLWRFTKLVHE